MMSSRSAVMAFLLVMAVVPNVALSRDDEVLITVRDRGPGVPDDQLEELFEPFYRIADSRDRGSGGTGLGLSIAQRAVRVHGGSVRALNAADGGLVVEIRLPSDGGDVEGPA